MSRGNPLAQSCLSNFPVPSSVNYLRRFHPSSQPLIKFLASSHRVFVEKGNYLVLDSNILSSISWSEMFFKNLTLAHFFNCLLNFLLFFYAHPATYLPWKILMMRHCQYLSPLMMNLRHHHYLIHPRMNCIFSF